MKTAQSLAKDWMPERKAFKITLTLDKGECGRTETRKSEEKLVWEREMQFSISHVKFEMLAILNRTKSPSKCINGWLELGIETRIGHVD